jgi:hypothetical protein
MAIRIGRRLIEKDDEGDRQKKTILNDRTDPEGGIPGRVDLKTLPPLPMPDASQWVRKPDLNQRREKLDFHLGEFRRLASAARKEAQVYLAQHSLMLDELEAEKVKLAEQQAHLDKLEANLPKFEGGKDEKEDVVGSVTGRITSAEPNLSEDDLSGTEI